MKLATHLTEGIEVSIESAQKNYDLQNDDFLFYEEEEDYSELLPLTEAEIDEIEAIYLMGLRGQGFPGLQVGEEFAPYMITFTCRGSRNIK